MEGDSSTSHSSYVAYCKRLEAMSASGERPKRFVPVPDHSAGLVTKVYDGDSLTLLCEVGGQACRMSVRIQGIDAPELHRGKSPLESRAAARIRDVVSGLCLGKFASVTCSGQDKYGRLLARVGVTREGSSSVLDLTEYLLSHSLAYPYDGGTKKAFSDVDLHQMIQTCAGLEAAARVAEAD